jgi:hypothetical protein
MNIKNINDLKKYLMDIIGRYDYMTYRDISRTFSIAIRTLYNDRWKGILQPINIDNSRNPRFSLEDLFEYLHSKKII